MDILILDKTFTSIALIDTFESLLWVDRYNASGDFELYTLVNSNILRYAQQDFYIWSPKSEHMMIIDERLITSDIESGNHISIKGRSLESIIDRRIVWTQTILSGNFQNAILRLLNDNIISPIDPDRRIPNFIFEPSSDPRITSLTIEAQFTGDNLYTTIQSLCENKNLGFKILLNAQNQFVFSLYIGEDRSYSQTTNPYVIFSPDFENIINSNFLETNKALKNVALVAGEGEGTARRTTFVGSGSGLDRREGFVDGREISSDTPDGILTDEEYFLQLAQKGNQYLSENIFIKSFEGDVETTQTFVYGEDFFLGDTVQIVNEFGIEASTRILEVIFSNNNEGNSIVPTFSVMS